MQPYNQVKLLQASSLSVLVNSIRTCWDSGDKSDSYTRVHTNGTIESPREFLIGEKDQKLVEAVIKKNHTSTLEHVYYTFKIERLPRYILQELMRHRITSPSVKSSRYTLTELKEVDSFIKIQYGEAVNFYDFEEASKYVYLSGDYELDTWTVDMLEELATKVKDGKYKNDVLKQIMPEAYLCDLNWSINARSLTNFFGLRLDSTAHFLIQELARNVYNVVPESHKFLYKSTTDKYIGA
jgi:thymidylate synthase (FAD)